MVTTYFKEEYLDTLPTRNLLVGLFRETGIRRLRSREALKELLLVTPVPLEKSAGFFEIKRKTKFNQGDKVWFKYYVTYIGSKQYVTGPTRYGKILYSPIEYDDKLYYHVKYQGERDTSHFFAYVEERDLNLIQGHGK